MQSNKWRLFKNIKKENTKEKIEDDIHNNNIVKNVELKVNYYIIL